MPSIIFKDNFVKIIFMCVVIHNRGKRWTRPLSTLFIWVKASFVIHNMLKLQIINTSIPRLANEFYSTSRLHHQTLQWKCCESSHLYHHPTMVTFDRIHSQRSCLYESIKIKRIELKHDTMREIKHIRNMVQWRRSNTSGNCISSSRYVLVNKKFFDTLYQVPKSYSSPWVVLKSF